MLWSQFVRLARSPDEEIDLALAALLVAAAEYPDIDIGHQLGLLDALAAAAAPLLGEEPDPLSYVNTISQYLFDEVGLRGDQEDYYDPRNSFLNEVLRRRRGIPISLSLVYIEVGKRLGVPLLGVGMPGHFLVRHREAADLFIDPFHGGILLSEEECAHRLRQVTGYTGPWEPRFMAPISNREFIARLLRNLKGIYLQQEDDARALTVLDYLVTLLPNALGERRDRGLVHYRSGHYPQALEDLQHYLADDPFGPDRETVQELVVQLRRLADTP